MKKVSCIIISILAVFAIGFTACSSDDNNNDTPNGTEEVVPGNTTRCSSPTSLNHCPMVLTPVLRQADL